MNSHVRNHHFSFLLVSKRVILGKNKRTALNQREGIIPAQTMLKGKYVPKLFMKMVALYFRIFSSNDHDTFRYVA